MPPNDRLEELKREQRFYGRVLTSLVIVGLLLSVFTLTMILWSRR